jgi:hypothetical protein
MFNKKLTKNEVVEIMANAVEEENRRVARLEGKNDVEVDIWNQHQYFVVRRMNGLIYDALKNAKVL